MSGMPERHSEDCKVWVGSETTAHWREIRLDFQRPMLEFGVRFGSLADVSTCPHDVRFTPNSGHLQRTSPCPLCANSGHSAANCVPSRMRNKKTALGIRRPLSGTRVATGGTGAGALVLQTEPQIYLIAKYAQRVDQERFVLRRDDVLQSLPLQQSGMSPKFFGIFRCLPCARTTRYPACVTSSFSPSGACKRANQAHLLARKY